MANRKARAALEDRRAAQEQQLKRAQLQAPSQGDEWAVKDQWVVKNHQRWGGL